MKQGDAAWLDLRSKHAITWSDSGNALGIGYTSRQKMMRIKLGIDPPVECNWRMEFGTVHEVWVREMYYRFMLQSGKRVSFNLPAFASDPSDRRLGGSPDGVVTDLDTGEKWLLECKCSPGGKLRTEIPISHLTQMHGLCHTLELPFAHYICWSPGEGFLLSEIYFHKKLWNKVLYPRYKAFADLWALRQIPERMSGDEKEELIEQILSYCSIAPIPSVDRTQLQQEQPQILLNCTD